MNDQLRQTAQIARQSLIEEVTLAPKPGLVDPVSVGAHTDMDHQLFLTSIEALSPYLEQYINLGYASQSDQQLFAELRTVGQQAEQAMLTATHQVNTHKGANFSYAFILGALGRAYQQWSLTQLITAEFAPVFEIIQGMTTGLVSRDFQNLATKTKLSYGEQLYVDYGLTGIRGEAEAGYPSLRLLVLPLLRGSSTKLNETQRLQLMLKLMANVQDMNLIHRGGIEAWQQVKATATNLLTQDYPTDLSFKQALQLFDQQLINKNLSPGGTADLLALGFFFDLLNQSH